MVVEGFFALAVVLALAWVWVVVNSVVKDIVAARKAAAQTAQTRERDARTARLYRTGEKLHCLGCGAQFAGPLGEDGCPQCHLAVLVVTEDEYRRGQAQPGGQREEKTPQGEEKTHGDTDTLPGSSGHV